MNMISMLLSGCGIIGASFTTQPLQLSVVDSKPIQVKCSVIEKQKTKMSCMFQEESPTQSVTKQRQRTFKVQSVGDNDYMISDESNSEIFQIKAKSVVYHQRLINDAASLDKVCVGNVLNLEK
jgi:hypothetical protein